MTQNMANMKMLFSAYVSLLVLFVSAASAADARDDYPKVINDILTELKELRKNKHDCNSRLDELEKHGEARLELAERRIQELESIIRQKSGDPEEYGKDVSKAVDIENNIQKREISRIRQVSGQAVAFTAGVSPQTLSNLGVHHTIIFDRAITNIGNAYHTATGIFTAPYAGIYVFYVRGVEEADHIIYLELVKDGNAINDLYLDSNSHYIGQSKLYTLELNKGSEVWVRTVGAGSIHGFMHTMWSGFLLYYME